MTVAQLMLLNVEYPGPSCGYSRPDTCGVEFLAGGSAVLSGAASEPDTRALLGSGVLGLAGVIRWKLLETKPLTTFVPNSQEVGPSRSGLLFIALVLFESLCFPWRRRAVVLG